MTTIQQKIFEVYRKLKKSRSFFGHGTADALDEAIALVLQSLGLTTTGDERSLNRTLSSKQLEAIDSVLERRIKEHIPLPYLFRQAYFCGLSFYIDERVLIPRSPLAEWINQQFVPWVIPEKVKRILDIGTGSGCIAIACAKAFPKAKVDAVDISQDALGIAKINVKKHRMGKHVRLILSDLFRSLTNQKYDIIISNPPYADSAEMKNLPKEYHHEPVLALHGGKDGLEIVDQLLREGGDHLADGGILIVEVGNARKALETKYPKWPFLWLDFERGDSEVFVLTKQQLRKIMDTSLKSKKAE